VVAVDRNARPQGCKCRGRACERRSTRHFADVPRVRDRRCNDAGQARAPLRMRLRSRPGRCCSEGCALQGLRFLARSGPWVAKPAGCRLSLTQKLSPSGDGRSPPGSRAWTALVRRQKTCRERARARLAAIVAVVPTGASGGHKGGSPNPRACGSVSQSPAMARRAGLAFKRGRDVGRSTQAMIPAGP
jgi:hypothetical protein